MSDLKIDKREVVALVILLILATSAMTYFAMTNLCSQNNNPTPTPSSSPTVSPKPTYLPSSTTTPKPLPNTMVAPTNIVHSAPTPVSSEQEIHEKIRDSVMNLIKSNHPETARFIEDLSWTGGRLTPQNTIEEEIYVFYSLRWNFSINYPAIPNTIYNIIADYSAVSIGIPYRIIWRGTWQNEIIKETTYVFAQ